MQERIDKINEKISNGIFLYGAGSNGSWCLDYLKREGIKVLGFIDGSEELQGMTVDGLFVYSYNEYLNSFSNHVVLITAKHCADEIFFQKKDENSYIIPFDTWFENRHHDDYLKLSFKDEQSYKVLNVILECMRSSDNSQIAQIVEPNQYFGVPNFFSFNTSKSVFVDLGACTGDTIERFLFSELGAVKKIYAFEPGKKQICALKTRSKRLIEEWALEPDTIEIVEACVGLENKTVTFNNNSYSLVTKITESNGDIIKQVTLDNYFQDKCVSLIKSDIEGSDYDALVGAEKLIKRCKPRLAISVYHKPDDLLRIYNLINDWNIGYKFTLRHHSSRLMDTVLYCW